MKDWWDEDEVKTWDKAVNLGVLGIMHHLRGVLFIDHVAAVMHRNWFADLKNEA